MENGLSDRHPLLMRIAICTAGYGMMSDNVVFPILNEIFKTYPNSSVVLKNFVVSGAGVFSIFFGILTGILMKYISKKRLLIMGTIIFAIGGVGGAFSTSMEFLAVTRAIDAASDGILTAVTASMIVDLWHDKSDQSRMFSWYNIFSNLFGVLLALSAGYLALINWHYAFLTNGFAVMSTVLCIFFVKDVGTDSDKDVVEAEDYFEKSGLTWQPLLIIFGLLIYAIGQTLGYVPGFLISIMVDEKNLGGTVFSGYLTSVLTFSGVGAYLIATPLFMKFKNHRFFALIIFAIEAADLFLYAGSTNQGAMLVAAALNGISGSWILVYFDMLVARFTPKKRRGFVMSIATSLIYLDGLLAPFVPYLVDSVFHQSTISAACVFSGTVVSILTAIYLILIIKQSVREKQPV